LNNKTCVVTGAARGIGRAIAARFHDEGAIVIVTDVVEATGTATAAEIGCRFEPLDVREESEWARLADATAGTVHHHRLAGERHGLVAERLKWVGCVVPDLD
jgi:NAD(P)-dependent dehydrogenase (short-subunit alcohol dehydrogenase family)